MFTRAYARPGLYSTPLGAIYVSDLGYVEVQADYLPDLLACGFALSREEVTQAPVSRSAASPEPVVREPLAGRKTRRVMTTSDRTEGV